ncbi:phosphotransferase [Roseovarius salis]|uniref:phosphotransferase n=1 Tax=Roseovarius salis TaxID=3376063 RepID=UPI0037C59CC0
MPNFASLPPDPTVADFRFDPPRFQAPAVADFLSGTYGIDGQLTPLSGERDQNFRLEAESGVAYVVKISGPRETGAAVDFQNRALEHIRCADPGLGVPRVVPTHAGAPRAAIAEGDGPAHHLRLLTHVPGVPLDSFDAPSEASLRAVGVLMGRMDRTLKTMPPPVPREFLPWDVMNGLAVMDGFRDRYLPSTLRDICMPFLRRFASETLPRLHDLPEQVIHNDLHAGNVLCDPDDPERLTGCIDFGDMVCRPTVMELSSALGEFAGIMPDFLAGCRAMLGGYRSEAEFSDTLLPLLYDAALARAVLCAQLAMFRRAHANNDPAIETVHLPGAVDAVRAIAAVDRRDFTDALAAAT